MEKGRLILRCLGLRQARRLIGTDKPTNQRGHPCSRKLPRAFDEKAESIVDSHDGTNQIQHPHWYKGASHE
jgi:hypothetical protein